MITKHLILIKNIKDLLRILPIKKVQVFNYEVSFLISTNYLLQIVFFFKNHIQLQFRILTCISCVDYPFKTLRFMLVYEFLSLRYNARFKIKLFNHELSGVESISSIFSTSSWYECEVWDLFGVFFKNHFDLKRILTDYGFIGHPLRKDFPLNGFIELRYSEAKSRVISQLVSFSQEFRVFNFNIPWKS